jgi:hypothetical protein
MYAASACSEFQCRSIHLLSGIPTFLLPRGSFYVAPLSSILFSFIRRLSIVFCISQYVSYTTLFYTLLRTLSYAQLSAVFRCGLPVPSSQSRLAWQAVCVQEFSVSLASGNEDLDENQQKEGKAYDQI